MAVVAFRHLCQVLLLAELIAVHRTEPLLRPFEFYPRRYYVCHMADFVIRVWDLDPHLGDMAPLHVHHEGDEGFIVLEGTLSVEDDGARYLLNAGELHIVRAGAAHTFATVGDDGARVLCVMTPEIDSLIQRLHDPDVTDMAAVWTEHHSSLVA